MRSDILVSVGVIDESGPAATVPRLVSLAAGLEREFRYFELVYVVSESVRGELDAQAGAIAAIPNLRIIFTSEGTRFYRRRLIAAIEAIGDVVAIVDLDEVSLEHLVELLGEANRRKEVLLGRRPSRPPSSWSYSLLSLVSRNRITAQAARTIVLPRELINTIVSRRSAALDLRFEPRSLLSRYGRFTIDGPGGKRARGRPALAGRYELFLEILICGVPRLLKAYAAIGFLVMAGAMLYGIYAVAVLLLRHHLQEGWFSTAITQAGSTAFIAGGVSVLSIAMTAIYERQHGGDDRIIVDEVTNTSFFDAASDRNVELTGNR